MKKLLLVLLCLGLTGCASNPFKQFYTDNTGKEDIFKKGLAIMPTSDPRIIRGGNQDEDTQKMYEDGYKVLGYSSFNASEVGEKEAII